MLNRIFVKNFRSLETADIQLGPLTVFYGPTASGKSSLMYSVFVLKQFLLNPNRPSDGFFNLGFMDLGGFDFTVFNHDVSNKITIGIEANGPSPPITYTLELGKATARVSLSVPDMVDTHADIAIPYALNQNFSFSLNDKESTYTANWNGVVATAVTPPPPPPPTPEVMARAQELTVLLNRFPEIMRGVDIAPHRRGFFKPSYNPVQVSTLPTSEDEVASLIINDQYLHGRISTYAGDVFDRDFRVFTAPGTATSFLNSTDKQGRVPTNLVNDGFGINQVIYLLAKLLRPDAKTVFIEEPEGHLHPSVIRKLAGTFCRMVKEEGKQIVIATHSEQLLLALLTLVKEKALAPDDLRCYLSQKKGKVSAVTQQSVNAEGQVEGGLESFVEGEIADLARFFKRKE